MTKTYFYPQFKPNTYVKSSDPSYDTVCLHVFFFQAEDGIRDLVRSRGLGDVYKRQHLTTRVSNPVRYPCFRASASVADQTAARR